MNHTLAELVTTLSHSGVKGMRWGVRRSDLAPTSAAGIGATKIKYVAPTQADKSSALMAFVRQNGRGPKAGEVVAGLSSDGSQAHVFVVKSVDSTSDPKSSMGTIQTATMIHAATVGINKDNTIGEPLYENANLEKELAHDDMSDNFLAHFGIKGMRWGVRRSDAQLADSKASDDSKTALAEFVRSNSTPPALMSDDEIRDTIARANLLRQYDAVFNPGSSANAELRAHVEKLELESKARQLKSQESSRKVDRVNQLIKTSANGFEAYSKLDKVTGGSLSKKMSEVMFGKKLPNQIDKLSEENKLLELARKNIEVRAKLNETRATRGAIAIGDAASRAESYTGGGKRRAPGKHKN